MKDDEWNSHGFWTVENEIEYISHFLPLEAFNIWIVVYKYFKEENSRLMLMNMLGETVAEVELQTSTLLAAMDVDQQRKEIIIYLPTKVVFCYYVKMIKSEFLITMRKQSKVQQAAVHVVTMDIVGFHLVLFSTGDVICYDTTSFETVWKASKDVFSLRPFKIWVDKFGCDFVIQCRSTNDSTQENLEYWTPPNDFTSCEIGQFLRTSIPLPSKLIGLCIESVGVKYIESLILIFTADKRVLVWRPQGNGSLILESSVQMTIPNQIFEKVVNPLKIGAFWKDSLFTNLSQLQGVFVFQGPTSANSNVRQFMITMSKAILTATVHFPDETDRACQESHVDISIMQLNATNDVVRRSGSPFELLYGSPARSYQSNSDDGGLSVSISAMIGSIHEEVLRDKSNHQEIIHVNEPPSTTHYIESNTRLSPDLSNSNLLPNKALDTQSAYQVSELSSLKLDAPPLLPLKKFTVPMQEQFEQSMLMIDNGVTHESTNPFQKMKNIPVSQAHAIFTPITDDLNISSRDPASPPSRRYKNQFDESSKYAAPITFSFSPVVFFGGNDVTRPANLNKTTSGSNPLNNMLRFISPFGILMLTGSTFHENKNSTTELSVVQNSMKRLMHTTQSKVLSLQIFSRNGLLNLTQQNIERHLHELSFQLCSIAYRTGFIMIVTKLREVFLFDINKYGRGGLDNVGEQSITDQKPIRLEFSVSSTVNPTNVVTADVIVKSPYSTKTTSTMNTSNKLMISFVGNSDGSIHYAITSTASEFNEKRNGNVVVFGVINAHTAPIVQILTVGDATPRSLWIIGTEKSIDFKDTIPISVAGSAIITIDEKGEVKTWHPIFTKKSKNKVTNAPVDMDKILSGFSMDWMVTGVFNSIKKPSDDKDCLVSSCALDPTCMNVIIGYSTGCIESWPIPGLIISQDPFASNRSSNPSSKIETSYSPLWSTVSRPQTMNEIEMTMVQQPHHGSILDIKLWIHLPNTQIQDIDLSKENEDRNDLISQLATYCRGYSRSSVGYTHKQLKSISSSSSMVTCSSDRSIILWSFIVSTTTTQSFDVSASFYLYLNPSRIFPVSDIPRGGICVCTTFNTNSKSTELFMWKLCAIVNGIVVTISEGTREQMFCDQKTKIVDGLIESVVKNESNKLATQTLPSTQALDTRPGSSQATYTQFVELEELGKANELKRNFTKNVSDNLFAIPAICQVLKPFKLLDSIAKNVMQQRKDNAVKPAWTLLDEWSKVNNSGIDHPKSLPPSKPSHIDAKMIASREIGLGLKNAVILFDDHAVEPIPTDGDNYNERSKIFGVTNKTIANTSVHTKAIKDEKIKFIRNGIWMVSKESNLNETLKEIDDAMKDHRKYKVDTSVIPSDVDLIDEEIQINPDHSLEYQSNYSLSRQGQRLQSPSKTFPGIKMFDGLDSVSNAILSKTEPHPRVQSPSKFSPEFEVADSLTESKTNSPSLQRSIATPPYKFLTSVSENNIIILPNRSTMPFGSSLVPSNQSYTIKSETISSLDQSASKSKLDISMINDEISDQELDEEPIEALVNASSFRMKQNFESQSGTEPSSSISVSSDRRKVVIPITDDITGMKTLDENDDELSSLGSETSALSKSSILSIQSVSYYTKGSKKYQEVWRDPSSSPKQQPLDQSPHPKDSPLAAEIAQQEAQRKTDSRGHAVKTELVEEVKPMELKVDQNKKEAKKSREGLEPQVTRSMVLRLQQQLSLKARLDAKEAVNKQKITYTSTTNLHTYKDDGNHVRQPLGTGGSVSVGPVHSEPKIKLIVSKTDQVQQQRMKSSIIESSKKLVEKVNRHVVPNPQIAMEEIAEYHQETLSEMEKEMSVNETLLSENDVMSIPSITNYGVNGTDAVMTDEFEKDLDAEAPLNNQGNSLSDLFQSSSASMGELHVTSTLTAPGLDGFMDHPGIPVQFKDGDDAFSTNSIVNNFVSNDQSASESVMINNKFEETSQDETNPIPNADANSSVIGSASFDSMEIGLNALFQNQASFNSGAFSSSKHVPPHLNTSQKNLSFNSLVLQKVMTKSASIVPIKPKYAQIAETKHVVTKDKKVATIKPTTPKDVKSSGLLVIDLPKDHVIQDRREKNALMVAHALGLGSNKTDSMALAMIKSTQDNAKSEVSLFFDRKAKPIIIKRNANRPKPLVSKRTLERENSSFLPTASTTLDSIATHIPSSQFDLQDFLDSLSVAERDILNQLDEDTRNQIFEMVRRGKFDKKSLLSMMPAEPAVLKKPRMELVLDVVDSSDKSIELCVSSTVPGQVFAVIIKTIDIPENFEPDDEMLSNPALLAIALNKSVHESIPQDGENNPSDGAQHSTGAINASHGDHHKHAHRKHKQKFKIEKFDINANSGKHNLTFRALRPHTSYTVFMVEIAPENVVIEGEKEVTQMEIATSSEASEILWDGLTLEMQKVELQSAIRCRWIQDAVSNALTEVILPSDDDIEHMVKTHSGMHRLNKKTPKSTGFGLLGGNKPRTPHKLRWEAFTHWWLYESIQPSPHDKSLGNKQQSNSHLKGKANDSKSFRGINIEITPDGDKIIVPVRTEYLLRECLFAVQNRSILRRFAFQRFCTFDEMEELVAYGRENLGLLQTGHITFNHVPGNELFHRFRSWYKGGQILLDHLEDDKHSVNLISYCEDYIEKSGLGLEIGNIHHIPGISNPQQIEKESSLMELSSDSIKSANHIEFADGHNDHTKHDNCDPSLYHGALSTIQLLERTNFLKFRCSEVDKCKIQILRLVDSHKHSRQHGLVEADLFFKRHLLTPTDLNAIMCSKKLLELCQRAQLVSHSAVNLDSIDPNLFGNREYSFQLIAGSDIFKICNPDFLRPDNPPPIEMATLPGTDRRPMKAWQLCFADEQTLELCIACSLDCIMELAIEDCILIPSIEDALIQPDAAPIRHQIWTNYVAWYAGDELVEKIPGKGLPTLARVLFAEEWEAKNLILDPSTINMMKQLKFPIPKETNHKEKNGSDHVVVENKMEDGLHSYDSYSDDSYDAPYGKDLDNSRAFMHDKEPNLPNIDEVNSSVESTNTISVETDSKNNEAPSVTSATDNSKVEIVKRDELSSYHKALIKVYERAVGTAIGMRLRFNIMRKSLEVIATCRRLGMSKFLWPPGADRTGLKFMFPRTGIITPRFELPPRRICLFPSRTNTSYTYAEMLSWYIAPTRKKPDVVNDESSELGDEKDDDERVLYDEDDKALHDSEIKGVRHRAYLEWLSRAEERIAEARVMMVEEDLRSLLQRECWKRIEKQMEEQELKLLKLADPEGFATGAHHLNIRNTLHPTHAEGEDSRSPKIRSRSRSPTASPYQQHLNEEDDSNHFPNQHDEDEEAVHSDEEIGIENHFLFMHSMPKEYWFIFEESNEFKNGNGLENGDELEDFQLQLQEEARMAHEAALKFENHLNEEKKKKEMEEILRLKREEQDRRLLEGIERRKRLREYFDEIKQNRILLAEQVIKKQEEAERVQLMLKEAEEFEQKRLKVIEMEQNRLEFENWMMRQEDIYTQELKQSEFEMEQMEWEDDLSYLIEEQIRQRNDFISKRKGLLEEIYVPFEPFVFKTIRNHPQPFNTFDRNEYSFDLDNEDVSYSDQIMSKSYEKFSGSSLYQETESLRKKKSTRFLKLFETVSDKNQFENDDMTNGLQTSSAHSIGTHESADRGDRGGSISDNITKASSESSLRYEEKKLPPRYMWFQNNIVQKNIVEVTEQAQRRKKNIRRVPPIKGEWKLLQSVNPQCFVRTSESPYKLLSAMDGLTNRHLLSSSQQLEPLNNNKRKEPFDNESKRSISPSAILRVTSSKPSSGSSSMGARSNLPSSGMFLLADEKTTFLDSQDILSVKRLETPSQDVTKDVTLTSRTKEKAIISHLEMNDEEEAVVSARDIVVTNDQPSTINDSTLKPHKKSLLLRSSEILANLNENNWHEMMDTKKTLSFASLHAMNSAEVSQRKRRGKNDVIRKESNDDDPLMSHNKSKKRIEEIQKSLRKDVGIIEESHLMNLTTKKLAQSASEAVIRMQRDRDLIKQYVASGAIIEDKYHLMACEPGIRKHTILENATIQRPHILLPDGTLSLAERLLMEESDEYEHEKYSFPDEMDTEIRPSKGVEPSRDSPEVIIPMLRKAVSDDDPQQQSIEHQPSIISSLGMHSAGGISEKLTKTALPMIKKRASDKQVKAVLKRSTVGAPPSFPMGIRGNTLQLSELRINKKTENKLQTKMQKVSMHHPVTTTITPSKVPLRLNPIEVYRPESPFVLDLNSGMNPSFINMSPVESKSQYLNINLNLQTLEESKDESFPIESRGINQDLSFSFENDPEFIDKVGKNQLSSLRLYSETIHEDGIDQPSVVVDEVSREDAFDE